MASKIYITSGLGPAAANEGFTEDYDLPNATAYAETCASVALIFWAQRMLHLDLDGRYADVLEQALFNGALCGLSRDGEHYFYSNPLDSDGRHERWAWHTCPCCTMNASRLIASVGGYFLSTSDDAIALHLYGGIAATVALAGGKVALRETSTYPWSGAIRVEVSARSARSNFTLKLRIPGWARGATATVNGEAVDVAGATASGYLADRAALAARRRCDARPADAARAHLRPPGCRGRRRPRRAAARSAGLLRRGGRQPRRPGAAAPAAPDPRASHTGTRGSVRRDRRRHGRREPRR